MEGALKLKREINDLLVKDEKMWKRGLGHYGYRRVTRTLATSIAGQLIDIDAIKSVNLGIK